MEGYRVLQRYGPAVALVGTMGVLRTLWPAHDPAALAEAEQHLLAPLTIPFTHRFVQAGSYQLHTLIGGTGPPLVLLHGHGGGVGVWHQVLEPLAQHFRVYAVEWLGWGRSDRPPFGGHTPEDARHWWLGSLEQWRQALGLTEFFLLGHSLGGWIAAEYALAFPQHIRHLVLVNPAGLVDYAEFAKNLYYWLSPQRMIRAAGPLGPALVEYGCRAEVAQCPTAGQALLTYYYQLSTAPLSGQVAFEHILTLRHWPLPLLSRAEGLGPTTILWGLEDQLLRVRHAHALHARLRQGQLILLPDASHSPHADAPLRFTEEIVACLSAVP